MLTTGLAIAGCTAAPAPKLPPAAPPAANVPAPNVLGLNPALSGPERIWHLRAALNVAALGCPQRGRSDVVTRYNTLLKTRKSLLADAYRAEIVVFRNEHGDNWQPPFDRYMTSLYNRFAAPDAQPQFCPVADAIAAEALTIADRDFEAFAGTALARIEAAFAAPAPPIIAAVLERRAAPVAAPVSGPAPTSAWRIQLGAYTGSAAAAAAWDRIRARQPGLAAYAPRYEAVPRRPELVRLQIGQASDRASALTLCALAAAGGFDCIPVRGTE